MIGPTEQVHLEAKRLYEDFNFIKQDGSWIHLEFESDRITAEDLRRFRSYEAVTGYIYHAQITTYVICSSRAKEILSELEAGYNTYRIIPLRLKDLDADDLFQELYDKRDRGEEASRKELIPLLLSALMDGKMPVKDRIIMANSLFTKSGNLTKTDLTKMQAVLYTLANKFLPEEADNPVCG